MNKKNVFLTLLFIFVTNFLFAQETKGLSDSLHKSKSDLPEKALEKAEINYLVALNKLNEGMIESAIVNIMIMKLYYPERNYENLEDKLNQLITEGISKSIRVKSFIACNYLKHPERYNWIKADSFQNVSKFFELYSEKIALQLEKTENTILIAAENE